jgi:hypothetical protein
MSNVVWQGKSSNPQEYRERLHELYAALELFGVDVAALPSLPLEFEIVATGGVGCTHIEIITRLEKKRQ